MKKSSSSGSVSNINLQEQAEAPNPRGGPNILCKRLRATRQISMPRRHSTAKSLACNGSRMHLAGDAEAAVFICVHAQSQAATRPAFPMMHMSGLFSKRLAA